MISHGQLMANMKGMTVCAEDNNFDMPTRVLASFLPLAHIFGYVFNIYMFISKCLTLVLFQSANNFSFQTEPRLVLPHPLH